MMPRKGCAGGITIFRRCCRAVTVCLLVLHSIYATTWFVAPDGDDGNDGTIDEPFATMQQGHDEAEAGDTIYFRGGTYEFSRGARDDCGVYLTKSGDSDDKRICYFAYEDERPVFDFSGLQLGSATSAGIRINGSEYLHFRGLEICNVPQPGFSANNGIWCNPGSYIIFELCEFHHNGGPGLSIANGNGGHLVLNCDSHNNFDPQKGGEDADGFGVHYQTSGPSTIIRGCRAWWNADDGFDCIHQSIPVIIENSWFWLNGYAAGTTDPAGNGQGVKGGGYGLPTSRVPADLPQNIIRNCVSFMNKDAGFNANYHPIACYWYNNTGFDNRGGNFRMQGITISGGDFTMTNRAVMRNNISFEGSVAYCDGDEVDASHNSWDLDGIDVTGDDFVSIDTTGVRGPRKADGSLPDIDFFKLAEGSDLIDKGIDVELPFTGEAPDLGAFEYEEPSAAGMQPFVIHRVRDAEYLDPHAAGLFNVFDLSGRRVIERAGRYPHVITIHAPSAGGTGSTGSTVRALHVR